MKRRDFIIKTILGTIGTGLGLISIPSPIENAINYSKAEIIQKEIINISLQSLEKRIMISNLLLDKNLDYLPDLHKNVFNNSDLNNRINDTKEYLAELVLKKSLEFSKRKPSLKTLKRIRDELNEKMDYMERIKDFERIKFFDFRNKIMVTSNNFSEFNNQSLKEYSELEVYSAKINELSKIFPELLRMRKTMTNISSDTSFIRQASKISKIPVEEIVTFADLESNGYEFAIGRDGEINRFQFIPKYIQDIYFRAISQKNELTGFILDKKVKNNKNNLLETIARDSELNIAIAANFMVYLKDKTKKDFQYILAYNKGVNGAMSLQKKTIRNLENSSRISSGEKELAVYKYYLDFKESGKNFRRIKESVI